MQRGWPKTSSAAMKPSILTESIPQPGPIVTSQPDVTVVSDQRLIASALASAVSEGGMTARHVTSEEMVDAVAKLSAGGCVIVDLAMDDAPDICEAAKENANCTLALLLTAGPDTGSDAASAITSYRPEGVLCADISPGQFVDALRMLLKGQMVYLVDQDARKAILEQGQRQQTVEPGIDLDSDQVRLLEQLASGKSDVELADLLHLSVATVRRRVARLRGITETANRIELAAWAGRNGIY